MFKYEEYNPPIRDQQAWNEYVALVEELRKTAPVKRKAKDGRESHHIIAKCYLPKEFWRDKENIIIISAKDHFRLHRLLDKALGGKMTVAFHRMLTSKQNGFKEELTEEEYQDLKDRLSIIKSEQFSKAQRGENNSFYGRKHSKETRDKISKKLLEHHPSKGKPCPEHVKKAISKANKGNQYFKGHSLSEASRKKLSDSLKGKPAWNKGIPRTKEVKQAVSRANKGRPAWNKGKKVPQISGENHPMYGKHHQESTRKKISDSHKGEVWSEERRTMEIKINL